MSIKRRADFCPPLCPRALLQARQLMPDMPGVHSASAGAAKGGALMGGVFAGRAGDMAQARSLPFYSFALLLFCSVLF